MLFLHFLRVLFSVRFKRRIIWLMPAAAHTINILLVQIPAIEREEREREASQLQIYVSISENIWAEPISMKYCQRHSLGPTPPTPPSSGVAAGDTGHQTPPPHSGSCLSSHQHPRTPTLSYIFSTLPNIFRHFQIFFLINICDKCIANYWAAAGHHRDSEDYCRSDWIRLNIVVTVIWAIEPSSNKRWN